MASVIKCEGNLTINKIDGQKENKNYLIILNMNLNTSSTNFLTHNIHDESEVFEIESNSSSTSTQFIQPKNYQMSSSPKKDKEKELSLIDYFKSLQM